MPTGARIIQEGEDAGAILIKLPQAADSDVLEQAIKFTWALQVYQARNTGQRRGVWRRSGIKGQVVHIFAKAERAFWSIFRQNELPDEDHFFDLMNYSAFALRQLEEMDKGEDRTGGEWPW